MMKNLSWRLKDLPTIEQVQKMMDAGIITTEEARSIFFKDSDKPSIDDLQEIKDELSILRKMILEKGNTTTIIQEIEKIRPVYIEKPWYKPYDKYYLNATSPMNEYLEGALTTTLN